MKVKIIKCSSKDYWYKDYIGGVFIVNENDRKNSKYRVVGDNYIGGRFIDAVDCEIIQEEAQMKLTEEEFIEIWGVIRVRQDCTDYNSAIRIAKQKGWIKKTALEEAREFVKNIDKGFSHYEQDVVRKCAELYEQAIKEVQEKE